MIDLGTSANLTCISLLFAKAGKAIQKYRKNAPLNEENRRHLRLINEFFSEMRGVEEYLRGIIAIGSIDDLDRFEVLCVLITEAHVGELVPTVVRTCQNVSNGIAVTEEDMQTSESFLSKVIHRATDAMYDWCENWREHIRHQLTGFFTSENEVVSDSV